MKNEDSALYKGGSGSFGGKNTDPDMTTNSDDPDPALWEKDDPAMYQILIQPFRKFESGSGSLKKEDPV